MKNKRSNSFFFREFSYPATLSVLISLTANIFNSRFRLAEMKNGIVFSIFSVCIIDVDAVIVILQFDY